MLNFTDGNDYPQDNQFDIQEKMRKTGEPDTGPGTLNTPDKKITIITLRVAPIHLIDNLFIHKDNIRMLTKYRYYPGKNTPGPFIFQQDRISNNILREQTIGQ